MSSTTFWQERYENDNSIPLYQSSFAEFIHNYFGNITDKKILDLGCGNGRDSFYFKKHGAYVIGIDQAPPDRYNDDIVFKKMDIADLPAEDINVSDIVYSRFFFHSITEENEDKLLSLIINNARGGTYICIEARTMNDPLMLSGKKLSINEHMTDHYRRFLDYPLFLDKLVKYGLTIHYSTEVNNVAVYKDDNPYVLRVIASV
jgi:tellurite methyltransferase